MESGCRSGLHCFVAVLSIALISSGCATNKLAPGSWIQVWPPNGSASERSVNEPSNSEASQPAESAASTQEPDVQTSSVSRHEQSGPTSQHRQSSSRPDSAASARPTQNQASARDELWQDDVRLTEAQRELLAKQFATLQASEPLATGQANSARRSLPPPDDLRRDTSAAQSVESSVANARSVGESAGISAAAASNTDVAPGTSGVPRTEVAAGGSSRLGNPLAASSTEVHQAGTLGPTNGAVSAATQTTSAVSPVNSSAGSSADQGRKSFGGDPGSTEGSGRSAQQTEGDKCEGELQVGRWRDDLQRAIESLERDLKVASELEPQQQTRMEAVLRLLQVVAERRDDSVRPIEGLDPESSEFWKLTAAGLYELLDPRGSPVADRRYKLALRYLREAVHHLAAASSLDVRNLAICRRVDSFGQYTEFEPYEFKPEQEVILYVEVGNFAVEQIREGYETEFQGSYQIYDAAGRRIADYDLPLDKQTCRNIRTDYFLPYRVFLPKNLDEGNYKIQVTIEDKKGKKFGQSPPVAIRIRR